MKKFNLAIGLLAVALSLTACKSRSIVGKWTSETSPVPGMSITIEFNGDKTSEIVMKGNTGGMDVNATFKSNYDLQGEKLTVTTTEVDLGTIGSMLPADAKEKIKSEMGKQNSGTLQWKDDNKITLVTEDGKSTVFVRMK